MNLVVLISLLVTSGFAAPLGSDLGTTNEVRQVEDGIIPLGMLMVVAEQPAFRDNGEELMELAPERALPTPISNERSAYPYQDAYGNVGNAGPNNHPAPSSNVVASFSSAVGPSAIPILLNCSPKVITGQLQLAAPASPIAASPAYRTVFSDLSDMFSPNTAFNNDFNLGNMLGLGRSESATSSEEKDEFKSRNSWVQHGAARYKVSEDFPEPQQRNHHLVSEDFPHPNMVKLTPKNI